MLIILKGEAKVSMIKAGADALERLQLLPLNNIIVDINSVVWFQFFISFIKNMFKNFGNPKNKLPKIAKTKYNLQLNLALTWSESK